MSSSENFPAHLRKVHFALIATCLGVLAAVLIEPSKEITRAHEDSKKLLKIKETYYRVVHEQAKQRLREEVESGNVPLQLVVDLDKDPNAGLGSLLVYSSSTKGCVKLGDIPIKGISFELLDETSRSYFIYEFGVGPIQTLAEFESFWDGKALSELLIPWRFSLKGVAHFMKTKAECSGTIPVPAMIRGNHPGVRFVARQIFFGERDRHSPFAKTVFSMSQNADPQRKELGWVFASSVFEVGDRPTHQTYRWSAFLKIEEWKPIPLPWRQAIAREYDLYSEKGSFAETFPEIHKYSVDLKTLQLEDLERHLSNRAKAERGSFEIFGARFPAQHTNWVGAAIILSLQYYLSLHLARFRRVARRGDASLAEPWIGLYPNVFAILTVVATTSVLPVYMIDFLLRDMFGEYWLTRPNSWPMVLIGLSIPIAFVSLISTIRVWTVCLPDGHWVQALQRRWSRFRLAAITTTIHWSRVAGRWLASLTQIKGGQKRP